MDLVAWAIRHRISPQALQELSWGVFAHPATADDGKSETAAQQDVRYEAATKGGRLFRNNVGALQNPEGAWVRYGLANESPQMNKVYKSSDLIGCMPVRITPQHVGYTIGQFTAREMKKPGWHYVGDDHEVAQRAFIEAIIKLGGNAAFCTGVGTL